MKYKAISGVIGVYCLYNCWKYDRSDGLCGRTGTEWADYTV